MLTYPTICFNKNHKILSSFANDNASMRTQLCRDAISLTLLKALNTKKTASVTADNFASFETTCSHHTLSYFIVNF